MQTIPKVLEDMINSLRRVGLYGFRTVTFKFNKEHFARVKHEIDSIDFDFIRDVPNKPKDSIVIEKDGIRFEFKEGE